MWLGWVPHVGLFVWVPSITIHLIFLIPFYILYWFCTEYFFRILYLIVASQSNIFLSLFFCSPWQRTNLPLRSLYFRTPSRHVHPYDPSTIEQKALLFRSMCPHLSWIGLHHSYRPSGQFAWLQSLTFNIQSMSSHLVMSRANPGGAIGTIARPKTYESNFIHHVFVQFEKTFASKGHFVVHCFVTTELWGILHLSCSNKAVMWLDYQILLKSPS